MKCFCCSEILNFQHIQQRLVTQMKRAASEEESKRSTKMKRVAKKSDKMVRKVADVIILDVEHILFSTHVCGALSDVILQWPIRGISKCIHRMLYSSVGECCVNWG